jgi:WD40 repeat protein
MVLFTSNRRYSYFEEAGISVLHLPDGTRTNVLKHAGMYPRYLPSGYLTYVTKGTLFAVPFDLKSLKVRGLPKKLIEGVSSDMTFGSARLDFSANGSLLYRKGRTEGLRTIQWLDAAGKPALLTSDPAAYQFIRISPDGNKMAWMACQGSGADIWILDLQRGGNPARLTDAKGVYSSPVWSPDNQYLVFTSEEGICWRRADGAGPPQLLLTKTKSLQFPTTFTTNGTTLVISQSETNGGTIWTVPVKVAAGQLRADNSQLFMETKMRLNFPAISPDGQWMAYADADSGIYEVYVYGFPVKGTRRKISNKGGMMPLWSPNGRDLFYRTEDSQIMVVTYRVQDNLFEADTPKLWSNTRLANTGLVPNFDLDPAGNRFAVLMPAEGPEPAESERHETLLMNFFDEVSRRGLESR